jgi:hypothetical protein
MLEVSSILITFAFPNNMFQPCNFGYTAHVSDIQKANCKSSKSLNTISNNPLLISDKLRKLLTSEVTHVAMLYCSGESVLSSFYNETPIEEFVGKNFIPAQK